MICFGHYARGAPECATDACWLAAKCMAHVDLEGADQGVVVILEERERWLEDGDEIDRLIKDLNEATENVKAGSAVRVTKESNEKNG